MKEYIKNIFKGQLFTTIVYLALGSWLVMFPMPAVDIICKVIFGIVLMLVGLYHIWLYLSEVGGTSIFNLFTGVILLVLGVFFFQNPNIVEQILPSLLAALLLVDSIWTLRTGLKLKQYDRNEWKFLVVVSLIFVTLGIVLFMNPFKTMERTILFAGWSFISDAVVDAVSIFLSIIGSHAIEKNKIDSKVEEAENIEATDSEVLDSENIETTDSEMLDSENTETTDSEVLESENIETTDSEVVKSENIEIIDIDAMQILDSGSDIVEVQEEKSSFSHLLELSEEALEEWKD